MNYAVIFAGGAGTRMNSKNKPKQLLELHGKPIILHTLEVFEYHLEIDGIVVVSLESVIPEVRNLIHRYELTKVIDVIPGGSSGFESIYKGLDILNGRCGSDDIAVIHDGVRPLVDEQNITDCITCAKKYGNAVTVVPATEGIIVSADGETADDFPDRRLMYATKAPQAFKFELIYSLYKRAKADSIVPVESAHLCQMYGIKLKMVRGSYSNIKITTSMDYHIFRALFEAVENSQVIGL